MLEDPDSLPVAVEVDAASTIWVDDIERRASPRLEKLTEEPLWDKPSEKRVYNNTGIRLDRRPDASSEGTWKESSGREEGG